jgi:hypothetical protein
MSLQLAAQHLAQHGRGNDKMLVHMTPKEVSGLQQLAQMHGGSLTKNPHTGLPEAGFLDSLMPAIIGFGITAMTGLPAWQVGLGVGAVETARTGNLGAGIMAGLGAYGGGSLGAGMSGLGEGELARESLGNQFTNVLPENATQTQITDFTKQVDAAREAALDQAKNASVADKLGAGLSNISDNPLEFAKNNWKAGLSAITPVVADQMVQTTTPAPTNKPEIHPFRYAGGRYERLPAIDADKFQGFADGGFATVGNDGNAAPNPASGPAGQLAFNNEPVMRMAEGGRIEDGTRRFDIGGEAAAALQSAYQSGSGDLQGMVNNLGVTQADVEKYFPGFDVAGAGLTLPGQPGGGAPAAPSTPAPSTPAPAAPQYVNYTPDQYASFFSNPANAAVLNTPGGLTAAETQFQADPAAVMAYLQGAGTKNLGLSAADLNALGTNQGLQGLFSAGDQWIKDHPNATGAEIQSVLKDAGWSDKDVTNYFNRPNAGYGTNLATGKAFTGAQDINTILGQKQGFTDLNKAITQWVKDHPTATLADAQNAMSQTGVNELDVQRATGKTSAELFAKAKIDQNTGTTTGTNTGLSNLPATTTTTVLPTNPMTNAPAGTKMPYGNANNPGDIIINPDGSKSIVPNVPGRPYGGFSGMNEVTNAYTAGGGHTGPANLYVPKTVEELNAKYPMSGGSKQIMDYLTGKTTENPILHPYTPTGEVSKDYASSVLGYPEQDKSQKVYLFDPNTKKYIRNPDYIPTTYDTKTGSKVYGKSLNQIRMDFSKNANMSDADWLKYITDNHIEPQQIADATGVSLGEVLQHIQTAKGSGVGSTSSSNAGSTSDSGGGGGDGGGGDGGGGDGGGGDAARGGIMYAAMGGQMYSSGGLGDLGSYSDGGRLLRGPGDGVSDSIPATIGRGKPARLADGEFVVPARIVSELGNGSTEAGARKLYAMMDRVQATRGKTIGKGKVAKNTRADKFLPA